MSSLTLALPFSLSAAKDRVIFEVEGPGGVVVLGVPTDDSTAAGLYVHLPIVRFVEGQQQ